MPSHECCINHAEAALFLLDGHKNRFVVPFLGLECSLAEAARAMGVSKSRMSYWVGRMLELGLIRVVRVEKRSRYNVPIYRSVADVFVFPIDLIPVESDEALLALQFGDFFPRAIRSLAMAGRKNADGWHVRVEREQGKVWVRILPEAGSLETAKLISEFGRLHLSEAQAAEMRREMRAVLNRFIGLSNSHSGKSHLYYFLAVEEAP
jgi:DNA-binding transcriptional ArsR family regulator